MAFYDYKCAACGQISEVSHGMGAKPAGLKCQLCGSADLGRVFQPVGTLGKSSASAESGAACSSCSTNACSTCR